VVEADRNIYEAALANPAVDISELIPAAKP